MQLRVHIEGMGITGCLLALNLDHHGIPFTWYDADAQQTAWKASTGAIYPAGKPGSHCYDGHRAWWEWHIENRFGGPSWLEAADYRFNHKKPPHDGQYNITSRDQFGLALAGPMSLHFNAQVMVPWVRKRFAGQEMPKGMRPRGSQVVVAHGFGSRNTHAYWGYTRLVEIEYDGLPGDMFKYRSAFYFREGRFVMAYAYPVAGTPYWYAGSKIIKQARGKYHSLDMPSKYEKWKAAFERLSNGACKVTGEADYIEGWRPARSDQEWVTRDDQSRILVPPLWNSGIRHFPVVLAGIFNELGIQDASLQHIKL